MQPVQQEKVVEAPEVTAPSVEGIKGQDAFTDYTLNVAIVSTDAEGNEYGVKTKMYKKGGNALYEIEEMTGPQELPFTPNKNLLVGNDLYSNIDINGESMWFKAANIEDQGDALFDLATMQEQLLSSDTITETKEEEVEGTTMMCYYTSESEGKVCLVDGIFAYGEDVDPALGMRSVIRVSNFAEGVDDAVFALPPEEDVKDIQEFMQLMMEEIQQGQ